MDMFVSDWMSTNVYTVNQNSPLSEAVKILREKKIKHLPVVDKKNCIGQGFFGHFLLLFMQPLC